MLTLPSNMFYTVTLPATLWFFDRAKPDDRILFIDARNVFTQIDRAHREFSEEQVANLAVINALRHGRRERFVRLVDRYFAEGMKRLRENKAQVEPVSAQLLEVLADIAGKEAVGGLVAQWAGLAKLEIRYKKYQVERVVPNALSDAAVAKLNRAQHDLRAALDPFFAALHDGLKHLDKIVRGHEKKLAEEAAAEGKRANVDRKTKALKTALEALHAEVKNAESFFAHIRWLQERFPEAAYEDVTGLCKLATPAEVAEQEYSLDPGRYVGVVIEEDGKTEEEFINELVSTGQEFERLAELSFKQHTIIANNLKSDCRRMMTSFVQTKLGNVLTFQRGFDITKDEQSDGDVPIVSSSGISSYHNVSKRDGPGLVIGRKGTLGTVHFLASKYWPHDTTLWVKDFKGNDLRFLYYFLQTLQLQNFDVGASNPTLNRNHLHGSKSFFREPSNCSGRFQRSSLHTTT